MVGEIECLRLRMLKQAHAPLLERACQPNEKFARTKAAAKAIDDATHIKSLGGAIPPLQLPCRKDFEERPSALVAQRHQRAQIAPLHELVRSLETRNVDRKSTRLNSSHLGIS